MMQRSFFGFSKPRFRYELFTKALPERQTIPTPESVTLLIDRPMRLKASPLLKVGTEVKTGQVMKLTEEDTAVAISSTTGTVKSMTKYLGNYGRSCTAVTVEVSGAEAADDQFGKVCGKPTLADLQTFLSNAPGQPPLALLSDPAKPIDTIVVYGGDTDLLIGTHQYILKTETEAFQKGVETLKAVTGIEKIVVVIPAESIQGYDSHMGVELVNVPADYPAASQQMLMLSVFGKAAADESRPEDHGICFMRAEAVVSIGKAITDKRVPVTKTFTVIDKAGEQKVAAARIGTPVSAVFKTMGITVNDQDRIIFGGPMTGSAIYDTNQPIEPDTDAIMVQDKADIRFSSDYPCINCGDCIRICPANIQVGMLVRFLEAGQYDDAANEYDLYSCVECGLCSFVCVSRIPILQHIKLAKYELSRISEAEEPNE